MGRSGGTRKSPSDHESSSSDISCTPWRIPLRKELSLSSSARSPRSSMIRRSSFLRGLSSVCRSSCVLQEIRPWIRSRSKTITSEIIVMDSFRSVRGKATYFKRPAKMAGLFLVLFSLTELFQNFGAEDHAADADRGGDAEDDDGFTVIPLDERAAREGVAENHRDARRH